MVVDISIGGQSDSEVKYKEQIFSMQRGPNVLHQIKKKWHVRKSDNIVHRIQEYANVGVDQFFLAFQDPNDTKS